MATQRVCNQCGNIIDEAQPYWTGQVNMVNPDTANQPVQLDFHEDHVPDPPPTPAP